MIKHLKILGLFLLFTVTAFSQQDLPTNLNVKADLPIATGDTLTCWADTLVKEFKHIGNPTWIQCIDEHWYWNGNLWKQFSGVSQGGGSSGATVDSLITVDSVSTLRVFSNPHIGTQVYCDETAIIYKYFPSDTRNDNGYGIVENGSGAFVKIGEAAVENEWEVYIWWGQSNSMGRDSSIAGLHDSHPRVFELTRGNHGKPDKAIMVAENPMNFYDNNPEDMSPALEFGTEIINHTDKKILIIPMSEGGYQIKFMRKNSVQTAQGQLNHYQDMLDRVLPLLQSPKFKLRGMYFQQGESDVIDGRYEFYNDRFRDIFTQLKPDLGSNFPVFLGNLPPSWAFSDNPNNNRDDLFADNAGIRDLFNGLNFHYVPSDGLQTMKDQVHYTYTEYERLGVRVAKKVAEQVYSSNTPPEKPIVRAYILNSSTAFIEWSKIYTAHDEGLTDVKVLINGVENTGFSNLITDHNNQDTLTLTGLTFGNTYLQLVASNQFGDSPASDSVRLVYTATAPTPNRHYQLDETSGTVITDSGSDNQHGTVTTDASNLTATLADAENGFDFDGTNTVSIPEINVKGIETYSICWDMEDVGNNEVAFGDPTDGTFNYYGTFSTFRMYFNSSSIVTPGSVDNTGLNTYCICAKRGALKIYRNAVEISPRTYFVHTGININTIGDGLGSPSFLFKSKLKDFRFWRGVFLNPVQMSNL